jgi:hypothetical protein
MSGQSEGDAALEAGGPAEEDEDLGDGAKSTSSTGVFGVGGGVDD